MSNLTTSDKGKGKVTMPEVVDLASSPSGSEVETSTVANKAGLLKSELEATADPLRPVDSAVTEKVAPQYNSTNLHIVHLRDNLGLGWEEIATELNKEAAKASTKGKGKAPALTAEAESSASAGASTVLAATFTKEMVYSRYIRTRHRLPAPTSNKRKAEAAVPVAGPSSAAPPSLYFDRGVRPNSKRLKPTVWDDEMDVFLVEAVREARANFWGTVAQRVREKTAGKKDPKPEECQGRYLEL